MLSNIKKITSAAQASSYYKKADYYTKGEDLVDISSAWLGKGAEELGLEGLVDHKMFESIMGGVLPDGTILDHNNRVIGWDLTFNMPKSASVMALVGGDNRILEAWHETINSVISFAESEFAVTRTTVDGETFLEKTGNYLVATFTHTTSRALDPHGHTHSVFMNATKTEDEKWRAVESNPLFDNRMLLGQAQQNDFAKRLNDLGYTMVRDDRTGQYEMAGVPRSVIDEFSKRRLEIEKAAEEQGISLTDTKAMEQLTLNTRSAKQNVPTSEVLKDWDDRMAQLDFDPQKLIDEAVQRASENKAIDDTLDPLNVVRLAMENLSFKESVFIRQDLIKETFRFDQHAIALDHVNEHIDHLIDKGELIETRLDVSGQKRQIAYTTPESVDREKEILGLVKAGMGKVSAMSTHEQVTDFIERYNDQAKQPLNESQQRALIGVATNNDRFQGLQGLPGVGKSTMMKAFNAFANEMGYKLIGIAPTGTAAQELFHKADMQTRTIDSLLEIDKHSDKDGYQHEPNTVYVVDESGMVSDRHTVALMRLNTMAGSRMIDSGDTNQLPAIEAGGPFEQKQKLAYSFEVMRDIKRQQNPLLTKAVYAAIDSGIGQAFNILKTSRNGHSGVSNIEDATKRLEASVSHYLSTLDQLVERGDSLSKVVNEGVKLITPLNRTKDESNHLIREGLIERGLINQEHSLSIVTLMPSGITPTEQHQAKGFEKYRDDGEKASGNVIRFHADIPELGIKEGDYMHVTKVPEVKSTTVSLLNPVTMHTVDMDMTKHTSDNLMTVFKASRNTLGVGEQIRWRDTYQTTDIKNGQNLEITGIAQDKQSYQVKVDDGRTMTLPANLSGGHLDYNYAVTPNSFQGGSIDYKISNYGQESKRLQTRKNLIVTLSRGIHGSYVYADNADKVAKTADGQKGQKTSALDQLNMSGATKDVDTPEFKSNVFAAKEGVEKAVAHLAAQYSAFNTHEIMRHAMRFSGQETEPVRAAIQEMEKEKALIPVRTNDKFETYYTNPEIVKVEKQIRGYLSKTAVPITATIPGRRLESFIDNYGFSDDARPHVDTVLTNTHSLSIVNARVSPETTLLTHAIVDIHKLKGVNVALVANTNQAQHSERLGLDVLTLPAFAKSEEKYSAVIMLDGHNASAKSLNRLLERAETDQAKTIVMGIASLSQDFAHKKALNNLSKLANAQTQYVDLSATTKDELDVLMRQSESAMAQSVKKDLEREAKVVQGENARHETIVADYLKRDKDTNIISASKEGAKKISDMIREQLKESGKITQNGKVDTIAPVFLSKQQKSVATEYRVGQVIFFNRKGETNGFTRQEAYVIEHIDPQTNALVLRSESGTRTVKAHELKSNGFSVNEKVAIELGKGDKVRFNTGVHDLNIHQNATGNITAINHDQKTMHVELESGRKVELDLTNRAHQFMQHGYTMPMNKASTMPMKQHALIELDGRFKSAANVQSLLKALSNAKQSVSFYADKRSTVGNYLNPSQDKERNLDAILHSHAQMSATAAKAHEQTQEHTRAQQSNERHQHELTQQRER
ncbi:MobF family relaxase [Alteromonas macleodii]|uniref:Conjugative relaxase domain protein n=1 Tax=Alteromonas macleodii TaxID=28108 RepID=A0AB36FS86_ALTMA|nr:MobF family relaxase [Alteromonas macleodii]OES24234.1 conjugative relaxase domain protein [Alteromonas macleodii]OES24866.1 conjugative relaxase domain protein [Alteromonas macleodii]OES25144.1 conjugative relaxase domain protein [Alteromonas macleodii]OES39185.1 conjugative relaxase domain protein [Alteromonas macleodii]